MSLLTDLLASTTGILAIVIVVGVVIGVFVLGNRSRPLKEVMFLRPRDTRGERMTITEESDTSIVCGRTNPVHRFIKIGKGYVFKEGGRAVTRFFGVEGTVYTSEFISKLNEKLTIREVLEAIWGKSFYERIPQERRNQIESHILGVTVEPARIRVEDYGLTNLTSDDIDDESDGAVLSILAGKLQDSSTKKDFTNILIGVLIGIGLILFVQRIGWMM
jgi:hypothetical protein